MIYRYTLTHSSGSIVLTDDEPKGWEDFEVIMQRDAPSVNVSGLGGIDTHGIFTSITTPLEFIGTGCDYLVNIYETYGAETEVDILIEFECEDTYTTVFSGVIDMTTYDRVIVGLEQSVSVSITDASFEQYLKNRLDIEVDLYNRVSLDGTTMNAFTDNPMQLLTQGKVIRKSVAYLGDSGNKQLISGTNTTTYLQTEYWLKLPLFNSLNDYTDFEIDNDSVIPEYFKATVTDRFFKVLQNRLQGNWVLDADYDIDVKLTLQDAGETITSVDCALIFHYGSTMSSGTDITIDSVTMTVDAGGGFATANLSGTVNQTITFDVDDVAGIYVKFYNVVDSETTLTKTYQGSYTTITTADITLYRDTQTQYTSIQGMRVYEALARNLALITEQNDALRSTVFGGQNTEPTTYGSDGENMNYFITNGFGLRGYPTSSADNDYKGLPISLKDLFKGLDAYFNIGMGVEENSGTYYVRIEKKSYFYDSSQTALTLSNVDNIKSSYMSGIIYNSLKVGNKNYNREYVKFNDDFLIENQYSLPAIKLTKNELDLRSEITASGYSIESQRSEPYTALGLEGLALDDKTFIISMVNNKLRLNATSFENSTSKVYIKEFGVDLVTYLQAHTNFSIVVTGTASNNGTFTITTVTDESKNGDGEIVSLTTSGSFTDETIDVPILAKDFDASSSYDIEKYQPETDTEYDQVNNIVGSNSSYNLRLSPARVIQRWMNVISLALQLPTDKNIKLTSFKSNVSMTTEFTSDSSDAAYSNALLSEKTTMTTNDANGDNNTPIFTPELVVFDAPFSYTDYQTLKTTNSTSSKLNAYHKIVLNLDDGTSISGYVLAIKYKPFEGSANFKIVKI